MRLYAPNVPTRAAICQEDHRGTEFPNEIPKSLPGIPLDPHGGNTREGGGGRGKFSGLYLPKKESALMEIIKAGFTTFVFTHG
jgi:hypothetical protein